MDETSTLQPFYLDSFEVDKLSLTSLGFGISHKKSFAKYFSRIRSLQLKNFMGSDETTWDMILLTSQTLTTLDISEGGKFYLDNALWLWCTNEKIPDNMDLAILQDFPFDLGRLPALRHLTIQLPMYFEANLAFLSFLIRFLSSSTSAVETLELKISWRADDFFSFGYEWVLLDELLTSEKFVSLTKVVLDWVSDWDPEITNNDALSSWELNNFALGRLFPKLRERGILEIPLQSCSFHDK